MVKRDLSNLIEKLEYVESNPELYNKLSNNLYEFAEKTFTKENINNHIVEVFKKNIFYSNSQSEIKSLI
jgi:glycosyltransferase involved in cell wall biosynthesis